MPRPAKLPTTCDFQLSEADRAFLHDLESLIHTIKDRITTFTQQYDPAIRPPSKTFAWSENYLSFPREYRHCAATLHLLHSVWHSVKALLNQKPAHANVPAHPTAVPEFVAAAQAKLGAMEARIISDVAKRYNLVPGPEPA